MNPKPQVLAAATTIFMITLNACYSEEFFCLEGTASGGTLILAEGLNPNPVSVVIDTSEGEAAASIAARLAEAKTNRFRADGNTFAMFNATGNCVSGNIGNPCTLSGTECGLEIPENPIGLTAFYDADKSRYDIHWVNMAADAQSIFLGGPDVGPEWPNGIITLKPSETDKPWPNASNKGFFTLWCTRDGIPSGVIGVFVDGDTMVECLGQPFISGVMPNWIGWKSDKNVTARFSEEVIFKPLVVSGEVYASPGEKPTVQGLFVEGGTAGILRPIPGLQEKGPVKLTWRYRIESAPSDSKWTVSMALADLDNLPSPRTGSPSVYIPSVKQEDIIWSISENSHTDDDKWLDTTCLIDSQKLSDNDFVVLSLQSSKPLNMNFDWFTISRTNKESTIPKGK